MNVIGWMSSFSNDKYINLYESTGGDIPWILLFVLVKSAVFLTYSVIGYKWWKSSRNSLKTGGQGALTNFMWIFFFFIVAEYFIAVFEVFFPIFKLEVIMNIPLVILMILFVKRMKYISLWYSDLHRIEYTRTRLQKLEWEKNKAIKLYRDKEESVSESSKALNMISKTKRDIERGEFDDTI